MTETTATPAASVEPSPIAGFFGNLLGAILVGTIEDQTK